MNVNYKVIVGACILVFGWSLSIHASVQTTINPIEQAGIESKPKKPKLKDRILYKVAEKRLHKVLSLVQPSDSCTQIFLKNGGLINAKSVELSDQKANYQLCHKNDGEQKSISKSEISKIIATNGDVLFENKVSSVLYDESTNEEAIARLTGSGSSSINGFAVTSMVLGISGVLTVFLGIGLLLGLLAIIFGGVALRKIATTGERGRNMALTGIICGSALLFLLILFLIIAFSTF